MATFSQKDVQNLFVGGANGDATAALAAMPAGEIGIFTPGGARITEASAATEDRFVIVQSRGAANPPLISPVIDKSKVAFKATARLFAAATQQIDAVGFNGTTGSIEAISDNLYMVDLALGQSLVSNHGGLYLKHGVYQSDATANQAEIATGIVGSLIANFSREPDRIILPEAICNNAGAAVVGAAATLGVVYGSKYVVFDDAHNFVAGDYIRIGGTAVTNVVYEVVNVTAGAGTTSILELAYKYQGATATVLVANVERITAVLAAAADFGVRITGIAQPFSVGKLHVGANSWKLTLKDFGTSTVTSLASANVGTGTENQVSELEWFCQGNEGDYFRMGEPYIISPRSDVSGTYDLIHIATSELTRNSIVSGPVNMQMTLAIPSTTPDYAATGTANDITDVLEVLIYGATNGNLTV